MIDTILELMTAVNFSILLIVIWLTTIVAGSIVEYSVLEKPLDWVVYYTFAYTFGMAVREIWMAFR